jgi:hypothetical protein
MITGLILGLFAVAITVVLLLAVRGQSAAVHNLEELEGCTQPVDLEAFGNLADPEEERYLRERLAPAEFRSVQRERLRATLGYVRRAARNASILLRVGEAARRNADPEIARAAGELVESALKLRMYALLAEGLLHARIMVPGARWSPARVAADYQGLRERVARLSRLLAPAQAGRISAAL